MWSSVNGPKDGSVTFCEATAPTPARANEQRAATAGDDDEMAMPNIPVSTQRATSENVMASIRNNGGAVDFDQPIRTGQSLNHETGGNGMHPFDVFTHGAIDVFTVAHVGDVDHHFHQMLY